MAPCAPRQAPIMEKVELFLWPVGPSPVGAGGSDELDLFNHGLLANGFTASAAVDSISHFEAGLDMFPKQQPTTSFFPDDAWDLPAGLEDLIHQGPEQQHEQALSNSSSFSDFSAVSSMQPADIFMEDIWHTLDLTQKENGMGFMDYVYGMDGSVAVWPVMADPQLDDKAGVMMGGASLEDHNISDLLATLIAYNDGPLCVATDVSHHETPSMPPPLSVEDAIQPALPITSTPSKPSRRRNTLKSRKMTERKRDQNKLAANRYRSKKRRLEEDAMEAHQALLRERDELMERRKDLHTQINMAVGLVEKRLRRA